MARPSKLTPDQWAEVERRALEGAESLRAIAKEFGIDEAAIRRRVNPQTPQVRRVAEKLADAHTELAALPRPQQYMAVSLADKLRNISTSLAAAAELGAATAHRLSALANSEVTKVDDADPLASAENLRGVHALTKLANDSASIALNLIAANKDTVTRINAGDQEDKPAPVRERLSLADWKKAHGLA